MSTLPPLPKCIQHISALMVNRYYFATISGRRVPQSNRYYLFLSVDDCVAYPYIQSYFGPPSLGDIYRYAVMLNSLMVSTHPFTKIVHCTSAEDAQKRTNAAFLVGAYAMLYMYMTPRLVYSSLRSHGQPSYIFFCDTSSDQVNGRLKIIDLLLALQKCVVSMNLCSLNDFDVNEYDHLHMCEHGVNMTWIVPNKLLAFMGPVESDAHATATRSGRSPRKAISPFYAKYFHENRVQCVIRCNEVQYDAQQFRDAGIEHHDLFFADGTCPGEPLMKRFLEIVERITSPAEGGGGAVAVHCRAGLGRTGVLIAAYLMKHYGLSANEAVGWLRICRPGSVIGVQHRFLIKCQPWLRHQGALWRKQQRMSGGGTQLCGVAGSSATKFPFGIYSINAHHEEDYRNPCEPDFVQVNKRSLNAVEDQCY